MKPKRTTLCVDDNEQSLSIRKVIRFESRTAMRIILFAAVLVFSVVAAADTIDYTGSLHITNTSGGTLFDGAFTSGTIMQSGGNTFLNASMVNGGTVLIQCKSGGFCGDPVIIAVPEPSTLGLVGSGLIGLAFMRRWAR